MNTRGSYGQSTFVRPIQVRGDGPLESADDKRAFVEGVSALVLMGLGAWWGSRAVPKDRRTGAILGLGVGYFAGQGLQRNAALDRIAANTAVLQSR